MCRDTMRFITETGRRNVAIEVIYCEDGGVVLRGSGLLTDQELLDANREAYASEAAVRAMRYQICDFLAVERAQLSGATIETIARMDARAAAINPNIPLAVVAEAKLMYGLSRIWGAYAGAAKLESSVFQNMEEAQAWLRERVQVSPDASDKTAASDI